MQSSSRGRGPAQPSGVRATILRATLLLLAAFCLLAPAEAQAYPWLIKNGYGANCSECHADPSGGELLTLYGRMISDQMLSTQWGGDGSDGEAAKNRARPQRRLALRAPALSAAGPKFARPEGEGAEGEDEAAAAETGEGESSDASAAEGEGEVTAEAEAAPAAEAEHEALPNWMPFFGLVKFPDWLLLGASYRHMNILPLGEGEFRTFPMMMDIYGQATFGGFRLGGSIGGARVAAGSPYTRRAQITTNQGKDWNLISRTHYVGYEVTPELLVRAGRLNLPFGVRIPEHTMWVRQATYTDRESGQQHGVAAAYLSNSMRLEVMGIAGNYQVNPDKFRERGYAGYFEYVPSSTSAVGISSMVTVSKTDRATLRNENTTRQVHGLMTRLGFNPKASLLAEFDGIFTSRREPGYVGFAQLDVEPVQGFHAMLTGEMLDLGHPDAAPGEAATARTPGQGKPKVGGWFSLAWFFYSHFDVRLDAIKRTDEDVSLLAQLHVYL